MDGHPRYRAEDRAEIFADSLEQQFQPNPDKDPEHTQEVETFVRTYLQEERLAGALTQQDRLFSSPGQVQRAIQRTKPRKAPGEDGITNAVLRHLPPREIASMIYGVATSPPRGK